MLKKQANYILLIFLGLSMTFLAGCAGRLSVPGGGETTNKEFYNTDQDFLATLDSLHPGMPQEKVFATLERKREDFTALDRSQLLAVLYGSNDSQVQRDPHLLQSLYGYDLAYKTIKSSHGFASPIRIRTDKSGYNYKVSFIFQNGFLFEKPIVSGGVVNNSHSSTLFDYLNPGHVLDRVI